MFITPAYAQSAGGAAGGDLVSFLFPMIAVGLIMWFLVIRPQRQQQKQRDAMLAAVRRNDTVITNGGLIGKVTKVVDDTELEIQLATDVKVRVMRAMLAEVRVKGDPVNDNKKPAKTKKTAKADKETKAKETEKDA